MKTIAEFSRRYRFSASHRLHVDAFTDEQNRQIFGKCNNPHGHGHNYTLQVTVRGPVDEETGMVLNMVVLDNLVRANILDRFDIQNLNLDPLFMADVSSTENLCKAVWAILNHTDAQPTYGNACLQRVRIEETTNNFFEFAGKDN